MIRNFIEKGRTGHTEEEAYRSCKTKGKLVLCDRCPAGYQFYCENIKNTDKIDQISLECSVCLQNKINLVYDCTLEAEEEEDLKYLRHIFLDYET